MKKNWILVLILSLFALLISPVQAVSIKDFGEIRCFVFGIDTPERDEATPGEASATGCYVSIDQNQEMAFVKNEDFGVDYLTTALTIKKNDRLSLKHFSMSAGEISMVEQSDYELNPLPIPPTLEYALESESNRGEIYGVTSNRSQTLSEILSIYKQYQNPVKTIRIIESTAQNIAPLSEEEFYLPEEKQPTDGYWWPHIGLPLARDEWSPLAKYDAYVRSVTGKNPNTVGWERTYHASSVPWAGHCNGWVSSAILYGYDEVNLKDEANNTIISSSDIQGLRSVLSYCTRNAFYGRRNYGPRSDINDIYPHIFHRTLNYYIKNLGKPVAYDFRNEPAVDNHIISGYKFTYQETETPNKYLVKAELQAHTYSYDDYVHEKRIAPIYKREYWYYLWANSAGRFYKGEWVNPADHPDFMWVPLSESRCGRENPRLRGNWIEHMLNNLERI